MPKNESVEKQKLVEKEYYRYWNPFIESGLCIHGPSDCVTEVLWLCWEMKQVSDQMHRFAQSLYPSFQRKAQFGGQLPILPPLAAFEPVYSALGAWTGPPGL